MILRSGKEDISKVHTEQEVWHESFSCHLRQQYLRLAGCRRPEGLQPVHEEQHLVFGELHPVGCGLEIFVVLLRCVIP